MSVNGRVFLDSHLFLHAHDPRDAERARRSREVIADARRHRRGVISTQVKQEFFSVATHKLGMDPLAAKDSLQAIQALDLVTVHAATIFDAIDCSVTNGIAFWDALIVAAAAAAGCSWIVSEDFQHGRLIRGMTIRNPFV